MGPQGHKSYDLSQNIYVTSPAPYLYILVSLEDTLSVESSLKSFSADWIILNSNFDVSLSRPYRLAMK